MLKLIFSCGAFAITTEALRIIFAVDISLSAAAIVLTGVVVSRIVEECF